MSETQEQSEGLNLSLLEQGDEIFSAYLDGRIVSKGVDITDNDTELARCFKVWLNIELQKVRDLKE